jgi:hypothetical protein
MKGGSMSTEVALGTAEYAHHTEYAIVVNGELAVVPHRDVSYEEAVAIAYPQQDPGTTYTVAYNHAASEPHEGFLVPGKVIEVKKAGTEFDVSPTGKS